MQRPKKVKKIVKKSDVERNGTIEALATVRE